MIDLKDLAVKKFITPPTEKKVGSFVVDPLIGTIFLTIKKFNEIDGNLLIYTANNFECNELYNALTDFINKEDIILIPANELMHVEYISESKDLLAEQVYGLYSLIKAKHKIIILPPSSLYRYYPSKAMYINYSFDLEVGKRYDLQKLKSDLIKCGYDRVSKIDSSLQFASRGDIIDVFSINYDNPIRIEFFDDEIESIRFFNIATQTSYEEVKQITVLPATLNLLSDEEINDGIVKISEQLKIEKQYLSDRAYDELCEQTNFDIDDFKNGLNSQKLYKYFGYIQKEHYSVLDYISNYEIIVNNEDEFIRARDSIFDEAKLFLSNLNRDGKSISGLYYLNEKLSVFSSAKYVTYLNQFFLRKESIQIDLNTNSLYSSRDIDITQLLYSYINNGYKIYCALENKEQVNKLISACEIVNCKYNNVDSFFIDENVDISISINSFIKGFEYKNEKIVVLTSKELFGYRRHASTFSSKFREGVILSSYQDLEPGDYVVHEKNGIGRFKQITTLEIKGNHEDYIEIQYDGTDVLFVPLYRFGMIRKYVGKEGYVPKLNKLFSSKWETTKKKIKQRIDDLAERLMNLYSSRAHEEGFAYEDYEEFENQFAEDFDYELTKDQAQSLKEIFDDMKDTKPMDRLLCGDVGFGKTEIAFRAAFKAIINNKQVVMICPTTLLARQHYELALKRFKKFACEIALYTRGCSVAEAHKIEKNVEVGNVNFIIGTHKALSKKLKFKDLGLLIIDEEQRFGVEQKEKIKEIYKGIDVLTLSATPIPRTLQSSLIGLKQVSTITTPPKERIAIQTYVINYDENIIRELIKRELSRHGQIFYIHNEVITIYETYEKLARLVPECRIGIVHGQMEKEKSLEVMNDFYEGRIDLLLATSIIENGIDVENANLMLIENANNFGLAQLYQIKGRVGRGDKMAYAYLMINKDKEITEDSKKRLEAIQDFSGLGSGYKIAQRDLLIRGAGDILGPEQAGFIDAIGIDMYIKLLNETIEEKKTNIKKAQNIEIKANLGIDGFIPSYYIEDKAKVEVYQRLIECKTIEELDDYKKVMRDIYGQIPKNTELLFVKKTIDIYLQNEEFERLDEFKDRVTLIMSHLFCDIDGIGTSLFTVLTPFLKDIKVAFRNKQLYIDIIKKEDWVDTLIKIFKIIDKLYYSNVRAKEVYEN